MLRRQLDPWIPLKTKTPPPHSWRTCIAAEAHRVATTTTSNGDEGANGCAEPRAPAASRVCPAPGPSDRAPHTLLPFCCVAPTALPLPHGQPILPDSPDSALPHASGPRSVTSVTPPRTSAGDAGFLPPPSILPARPGPARCDPGAGSRQTSFGGVGAGYVLKTS